MLTSSVELPRRTRATCFLKVLLGCKRTNLQGNREDGDVLAVEQAFLVLKLQDGIDLAANQLLQVCVIDMVDRGDLDHLGRMWRAILESYQDVAGARAVRVSHCHDVLEQFGLLVVAGRCECVLRLLEVQVRALALKAQ